jgi:hypothetical protein
MGLCIEGINNVALPITDHQAKTLKGRAVSYKINNDAFTKVYQIEGRNLRIHNPEWEPAVKQLLVPVSSKMGINPDYVSAELNSLIFFEKGSSICWTSDAVEENVIGTLLIQLPSEFAGRLNLMGRKVT